MDFNKEKIYQKVADKEISIEEALKYIEALENRGDKDNQSDKENEDNKEVEYYTEEDSSYPLSQQQRSLWIAYNLDKQGYSYNVPFPFWIYDEVDVKLMEQAIQFMIKKHPGLSVTFGIEDEKLIQRTNINRKIDINQKNIDNLSNEDIKKMIKEESRRSFDIEEGPNMRLTLFSLSKDKHVLLLVFHHIIMDAICVPKFVQEFIQYYELLKKGGQPKSNNIKTSYEDFVYWQKDMLESEAGQRHREYWLKQLEGELTSLEIPVDKSGSVGRTYEGASFVTDVNEELSKKLNMLCLNENVSLYNVMLTTFKIMLHKYSQQDEILIGTPMLSRPEARFESVLGYFSNLIVIRSNLSNNPTFKDILLQVKDNVLDAFEHSNYPLLSVIEDLNKGVSDIFQACFALQNWFKDFSTMDSNSNLFEEDTKSEDTYLTEGIQQEGVFDIMLEAFEYKDKVRLYFKYNGELFEEDTIKRMANHYITILKEIVNFSDKKISEITMLTEEELQTILVDWNKTEEKYPSECVHEIIEENAKLIPDSIAVIYEDQQITYKELSDESTKLAVYLRDMGVKSGTLVGIFLDRSIEMVISLLGVLKAGGAYVPLDPKAPNERLEYMMEDSQLSIVLTDSSIEQKLPESKAKKIILDKEWKDFINDCDVERFENYSSNVNHTDLAYVIYTSGSTGKPKGVQIWHRGFSNMMSTLAKRTKLNENDHCLVIASICFDMSVLEMFLPLSVGAKIEVVSQKILKDGIKLKEKLDISMATFMTVTPSTYQMLFAAGWENKNFKMVWSGGEAFTEDLANKVLEQVDNVWNIFGPTETSALASVGKVELEKKVHVGKALGNYSLYILDKYLNPVPIGVSGELYIGGVGVYKPCYLNKPDINKEKFVVNPFNNNENDLLYKSGDLVKYLPDGNIDFINRIGGMVKFKGLRIELGEIESAIKKIEAIHEAVVVIREDDNNHKELVAFLKVKSEFEMPKKSTLMMKLKKWLPTYMIPSIFIVLDELPMTLSLKVDKKKLTLLKLQDIMKKYKGIDINIGVSKVKRSKKRVALPKVYRTKDQNSIILDFIHKDIASIVSEVLNIQVEDIDITNHMNEYGFDSIRSVTFAIKLKNEFDIELSPTDLFEYPSIENLARYLLNRNYDLMRSKYIDEIKEIEEASSYEEYENLISDNRVLGYKDNKTTKEPIAIIGIAGKMPQSKDLNEFWTSLINAECLVTEVDNERKNLCNIDFKYGGFMKDIDEFDASFFNISEKEVVLMDPQQRLFLETAWKTIEDSGYRPSDFAGTKTGVFVGANNTDYKDLLKDKNLDNDTYSITGTSLPFIANRVSSVFSLKGPSETISTECSSSLVSVIKAITAINNGDCDMALAGGVNVLINSSRNNVLNRLGLLNDNGKCKVFDKNASGYVRGEGVGAILLKPLNQAKNDGDNIYAVIKGSAVKYGGYSSSLINTNIGSHEEVLIEAYQGAEINPNTITYIETHGVGNSAMDSTEVNALIRTFDRFSNNEENSDIEASNCGLGSVKTNIGHLEGASGIASLFKVILSVKNKVIPPSINFEELNPSIDLHETPFYITKELTKWDTSSDGIPRRAGISSFGMGGTNAHILLEEYNNELIDFEEQSEDEQLIVLSAQNIDVLKEYVKGIIKFLNRTDLNLRDIAFTLQSGRESLKERIAFIVSSIEELVEKLNKYSDDMDSNIEGLYKSDISNSDKKLYAELNSNDNIEDFLNEKNLVKLAQLWVSGIEIDWKLLNSPYACKRISLPTYPFDKKSYWVLDKSNNNISLEKDITIVDIKDVSQLEIACSYNNEEGRELNTIKDNSSFIQEYINMLPNKKVKVIQSFVKVNSGKTKLEVLIAGKGVPILLIPGFGLTARQWRHQFRAWASKYQLIVIHPPGIGMTEACEDQSFENISKLYIEVLDKLNIKQSIHVIGSSWGGMLAQFMARFYNDRISSLILANSACKFKLDQYEYLDDKIEQDFKRVYDSVEAREFRASTSLNSVAGVRYAEILSEGRGVTLDFLSEINVPTLVVAGKKDIIIEQTQFHLLHKNIQNSKYQEILEAGHAPNMTHYKEFNKVTLDFINNNIKNRRNIFRKIFQ